jgi:hypothetical protein
MNQTIEKFLGIIVTSALLIAATGSASPDSDVERSSMKILFLHHSTGEHIWRGGIPEWFDSYNEEHGTAYKIEERIFPKQSPYGWNNYPFDYWNIWVKHAGTDPHMEEPTLEILSPEYDVIVFKHCFPVSDILPDQGTPSIDSDEKRMENYILQYEALKVKMHEFPDTRFIVWTPAPRVELKSWRARLSALLKGGSAQKENAERARAFADWVVTVWDEPGDNIFVWDFFTLGTEGDIFLKSEYSENPGDSHPNSSFSRSAAEKLCQRIVDVIEGRGDQNNPTGD